TTSAILSATNPTDRNAINTPNTAPRSPTTTAITMKIGSPTRNSTSSTGAQRTASTAITGSPIVARRIAIGISAINAMALKNSPRMSANIPLLLSWGAYSASEPGVGSVGGVEGGVALPLSGEDPPRLNVQHQTVFASLHTSQIGNTTKIKNFS